MRQEKKLKNIAEEEISDLTRKQRKIETTYFDVVPHILHHIEEITGIPQDKIIKYAIRASYRHEEITVSSAIDVLHTFFLAKWQEEHTEEK